MEYSNNKINYRRLVEALDFYENLGYKYLDVDWHVPKEISSITKPPSRQDLYLFGDTNKCLVASSEQSMLDLTINKQLPPAKYLAISACFRNEEILDITHQEYFMKVELFQSKNVNSESLDSMINICQKFFNNYTDTKIEKMSDNEYDIIDCKTNCELGSYGIREITFNDKQYSWIFGTALAEPRLSKVIHLNKI